MAVSSTTNRIPFSGDGSTTAFSFPEFLNAATDIVAVLVDNTTGAGTPWVKDTDYTVALTTAVNGVYPSGATVNAVTAPALGKTLILYRDVPVTQSTHWTDNDPMPSATTENTHDRAFTVMQRLKDLITRAVRLPDGFYSTFDPTLPVDLHINGGGKCLALKSDASGFDTAANWPTAAGISGAVTSAAAAAASATSAAGSASSASTSASAASASAIAAATSATNAAASATAAAASAVTAAAAAASAVGIADQQVLAGTFAAGNTTYTIPHTPNAAAGVLAFLGTNPQAQGTDYTLSGVTITFTGQDTTASNLLVFYRY